MDTRFTNLPTILSSFSDALEGVDALDVAPLAGGLINDTFTLGGGHVLQRLHPVFAAPVNLDIEALTSPLRRAGVPVPRLLRANDGAPYALDAEGRAWRVMTRMPGQTLHRLERPAQVSVVAAMLARFHAALLDVEHTFAFTRPGAHDTHAHMANLTSAIDAHRAHRLHAQVAPVAETILTAWQGIEARCCASLPTRIVHGDPKVSNFLFSEAGAITAVLDLDTMAHADLEVELGDAMRSWCNRADESSPIPRFDTGFFKAAVEGYTSAMSPRVAPREIQAIPGGTARICLELSARFAVDALEERYFGWSVEVAPTRGEHNLLRARNQLEIALQVVEMLGALDEVVGAEVAASSSR